MSDTHYPTLNLRRFNGILSVIIVVLAGYIFLLPVLPQADWWWHHSVPVVSRSTRKAATTPATTTVPVTKDNRLAIPAIGLDEHLYEGQSVYTVNKGVWVRPNGSTPAEAGNTILVGHRLTYTNPRGVFYFLDKIKIGDPITVYWQGRTYIYKTQSIREVSPTDVSVEAPSSQSELTLYTCTPLWTLKNRLVVVASLETAL